MNKFEENKKKIGEKIASAEKATPFVDDLANDNIHGMSSIRRNDGTVKYSSSVSDETKPKRRVTKMSRKRYRKQNGAVILLVLLFTAVLVGCALILFKDKKAESAAAVTSDTETEVESSPESEKSDDTASLSGTVTLEDVETSEDPSEGSTEIENTSSPAVTGNTTSVTVPTEKIHDGNLILVNYKYEYVFPEEDILIQMKSRAEHFSVSTLDVSLQSEALDAFCELTNDLYENSGCGDVLVVSSFRGVEKQEEIYQDRLERYGSAYAAAYVALPGYSEHHTGLAMDLSIYTGGASYDIETYPGSAWFMDNYDRYGYILRYPEHKAGITSINYEGWHYRYVGLPHSLIMDKEDLCLEEYTDYVREHTIKNAVRYDKNMGTISTVDAANTKCSTGEYFIYFVPASDNETTEIPVPEGEYKISGNNVDGFVVTVTGK